jgi:hypothetical protein
MGKRISSHSRLRFDFPVGRGKTNDASAMDKTGWAGPFTRAQLVELFWRAEEIKITASGDYEYVFSEVEGVEPLTGTLSLDVTLVRVHSVSGVTSPGDELDVFRSLMTSNYGQYEAEWVGSGASGVGSMYVRLGSDGLLKDAAGYWLAPVGGYAQASCGAIISETLEWEAGGDEETGTWDAGSAIVDLRVILSTTEAGTIAATINLGGGAVAFPLQTSCDGGSVSAATIAVTKWFEYATSTGAAAWNASTGAPVNGGPGA